MATLKGFAVKSWSIPSVLLSYFHIDIIHCCNLTHCWSPTAWRFYRTTQRLSCCRWTVGTWPHPRGCAASLAVEPSPNSTPAAATSTIALMLYMEVLVNLDITGFFRVQINTLQPNDYHAILLKLICVVWDKNINLKPTLMVLSSDALTTRQLSACKHLSMPEEHNVQFTQFR